MSPEAAPNPPRVFISYAQESPEHQDRVLALATRLRQEGIDAILDKYQDSPPEGWPRWMDKQIRDADFVLMICTKTYYRRVMGEEEAGKGRGVRWEGHLIYQHFYDAETLNTRFLPVLFEATDHVHIPTPYRGSTRYVLERDYEMLYRRLTGQPLITKPGLGKMKKLPAQELVEELLPWNVPYPRNRWFTGREPELKSLRNALTGEGKATPSPIQAITGMGGVGKTQTAVEYAYRHRDFYNAVLWTQADTEAALSAGFLEIARVLELPEKDAADPAEAREAVKRWLGSNDRWLLVFDNLDKPERVKQFLPRDSEGHVVLTSRTCDFQVLGISNALELKEFGPEEATQFLLKRTGRNE